MYKKIAVILLISNLIISIFLYLQYQENKEIKNVILKEYIQSQQSISINLIKALDNYEVGDEEAFYSNIKRANEEFTRAYHLLGNNSIGEITNPPHSLFQFNKYGMSIVDRALFKLYKDDLNSLNIEDIEVLSDKMSQLVGKLDYDEIKSNNSNEAFGIIEEIIKDIR